MDFGAFGSWLVWAWGLVSAEAQGGLTTDMRQEFLDHNKRLDSAQRLAECPEEIRASLRKRSVRAFDLYRKHLQ